MKRRSLLMLGAASGLQAAFGVTFPAQAATPAKRGGIAVGLSGIADWGASQPFIDVMRQSREWMGRSETEFVSHTNAQLREGGHLDADGWPISIPDGSTAVGTIILCDLSADDTSLNGNYRVTWDGTADVRINGTGTNVTTGPGWAEFDYVTSDTGIVAIDIVVQDATDPARNFRCIHQALQAEYDAGQIFRPEWLALIGGFRVIRFMDWMATNDSTLAEWDDRQRPTSATWTTAVPVEVMVTLANQLGVDPWFCFPHLATDDHVTRFATAVRDSLDPGLTAWYEFSNEVWNFQFGQTQWALQQAEKRWPGQGDGWMQVYGGRAAQMAMLLDAVYADAPDRLRKVITAHTAWIDLNHAMLDAPLWVADGPDRRAPKTYFDAYAVTGYFDGGIGRPANLPLIRSWRDMGDDRAFDLMAEQVADGRHIKGEEGGTTIATLKDVWAAQQAIAQDAGLSLVMYEGGSHIVPDRAAIEADPDLFDFLVRFHYSDQMGGLYRHAIDSFDAAGGAFFNAFVEMAVPGPAGFWGARRHVGDDNPRWQSLVDQGA